MTSSSKKITYTSDFKLKILDYYFKHGGDEHFGLKKQTAGHFNIDKKTINRMFNNPDMVKRARRLLSKRVSATTSSSKHSTSSSSSSSKTSKGTGKQVKTSKATAVTTSGKLSGTSGGSSKSAGSCHGGGSHPTASIPSGSGGTGGVSSTSTGGAGTSGTSSTSSSSTSRVRVSVGQASSHGRRRNLIFHPYTGVKVLELPEDPDYSLLKRSINALANGVANVAKLLVTGMDEVRKLILNDCEMILECKVCQNLFRSVVNFLAHKRIYCQEEFADVRTLFHRDNTCGMTSQSGTVVVEPEHPPPSPIPPPTCNLGRSPLPRLPQVLGGRAEV